MGYIAARRLLLNGQTYEPGDKIDVPIRRALINQGWVYDPTNRRQSRISLRRKMPTGIPGGIIPEAIAQPVIIEPQVIESIVVDELPEESSIEAVEVELAIDISALKVLEVKEAVAQIDSLDTLRRLDDAEKAGKARKMVAKILQARIIELEE